VDGGGVRRGVEAACGGAWRRRAERKEGADLPDRRWRGRLRERGRDVRGEGAGRVKARRWRAKGEPMGLSYFHTF
jgi:hypothetical protein